MQPSSPAGPTMDELLAHAAWARRFACRLVRDAAAADDLVQDAWLAALRRPPHGRLPLRAWLAKVLRNRASSWLRSRAAEDARARRLAQVSESAQDASAASPADVVAHAELLHVLTGIVTSLDEPLRTVVLLRYYQGLPVAEIAARLHVPVGTVTWRIHRAVEVVRGRLDRRHPGGRQTWLAAMTPFTGAASGVPSPPPVLAGATAGGGSAPILGGLLMNAKLTGAAACVATAAVLALGLLLRDALGEVERVRTSAAADAARLTGEMDLLRRRCADLEATARASESRCGAMQRELDSARRDAAARKAEADAMGEVAAAAERRAAASGERAAIGRIAEALSRAAAIESEIWNLGGDPDAWVDDPSKLEDRRVAEALRRYGAATSELVGLVMPISNDASRAQEILGQLAREVDPETQSALVLVLTAMESAARLEGAEARAALSDGLATEFARANRYSDGVRARMLGAIDFRTGKGAELRDELLRTVREGRDPETRLAAIRCSATLEDPRVAEALREVIDSAAAERMRVLAIRALSERMAGSDDRGTAELLARLAAGAAEPRVRAAAREGLATVHEPASGR